MESSALEKLAEPTPAPELPKFTDRYGLSVLLGLTAKRKHVYAGTVPAAVVERRRAKNRVARRSRRANRG